MLSEDTGCISSSKECDFISNCPNLADKASYGESVLSSLSHFDRVGLARHKQGEGGEIWSMLAYILHVL